MKLSEFKVKLSELEHELFLHHKLNSSMGTAPVDPEVFVNNLGVTQEPLCIVDAPDGKIYL